jgi:hypothetical protein
MRPILILAVVAACSGGPRPAADPPANHIRADADLPAPPTAHRCLPVVAFDCGCVYGCGDGTEQSDGSYQVVEQTWSSPVRARVSQFCIDDECTDAFFGEIICDGICAPHPADATCHFDGSPQRCQSGM